MWPRLNDIPQKNFLYIVYNKSAKDEAIRKFLNAGVSNVTVETSHSLAYRGLDVRNRYELAKSGNLKAYDIVKLCDIKPSHGNPVHHLVLARHVQKFLTLFCNSDVQKLADIDYSASITDAKAAEFANKHYEKIHGTAHNLLTRMYRAEVPIIHDAYLKFWQLTQPELPYMHIMMDEAQDISPVMLDVFLRQKAIKTAVGDSHQAIYGFRNAVNSLEKIDFKKFNLTASYRFNQEIADLATKTLKLKRRLRMLRDEPTIRDLALQRHATHMPYLPVVT